MVTDMSILIGSSSWFEFFKERHKASSLQLDKFYKEQIFSVTSHKLKGKKFFKSPL
jgi:hypothetical protein